MFKNILIIVCCCFLYANTSMSQIQKSFLLQQPEMPGFVLKDEGPFIMNVSEGQYRDTISQTWTVEEDTASNIFINYGVFDTAEDAFRGAAYLKGSMAIPFGIGTLNGYIFGDKSWFPENSGPATIFLRGNVVVHISKVQVSKDDFLVIEHFSRIILDKIEKNLSAEIQNNEAAKRETQITSEKFQRIVGGVTSFLSAKAYTPFSSWDSKWFTDSNGFTMGKRIEWKDYKDGIIGIDIAEFSSPDLAENAKKIRITMEECPNQKYVQPLSEFDISSPSSVDSLIVKWKTTSFHPRTISAISSKNIIAVHVYHYAPYGVDTITFSNIVKELRFFLRKKRPLWGSQG